jgi:hypothetical protein
MSTPPDTKVATIDRLLEILRSARDQKAMHFAPVDVAATLNFLNGFFTGCFAFGHDVPIEIQKQVATEHGWRVSAMDAVEDMREHGLTEEEIIKELYGIQIEILETYRAAVTA